VFEVLCFIGIHLVVAVDERPTLRIFVFIW
jgi:hypothetical protein